MDENLKKLTDLGITEENARALIHAFTERYESDLAINGAVDQYCSFVHTVSNFNVEDSKNKVVKDQDDIVKLIGTLSEMDLSKIEYISDTTLMFLIRVAEHTRKNALEELYARYGVRLHQ